MASNIHFNPCDRHFKHTFARGARIKHAHKERTEFASGHTTDRKSDDFGPNRWMDVPGAAPGSVLQKIPQRARDWKVAACRQPHVDCWNGTQVFDVRERKAIPHLQVVQYLFTAIQLGLATRYIATMSGSRLPVLGYTVPPTNHRSEEQEVQDNLIKLHFAHA